MNRLLTEFARLYTVAPDADDTPPGALIDARGRVRALVIELARPASWEVLGRVWRGVQTTLELPAPGIAVSGTDGLQLWFSLALPIDVRQAHGFLEALRSRFLPEVPTRRVALWPSAAPDAPGRPRHAAAVPACNAETGNWSAFVAADLAPVFAETPWLDLPPNEEGQATLLRALDSIKAPAFESAWQQLRPPADPSPAPVGRPVPDHPRPSPEAPPIAAPRNAAQAFLLQVMNDADVPLALRIEAARALLQVDPTAT